jgi:MarR-like DNA-binding transcriptional regulator SgrR of sgrS sRNA
MSACSVNTFKAVRWAEQQALTGRKKQLLLAIARGVDETGGCRSVTQEALAASCSCTVRQVRRLIGELAAERYLAHLRRGRCGGGRAADLYVMPREARQANAETKMSALVDDAGKPDI